MADINIRNATKRVNLTKRTILQYKAMNKATRTLQDNHAFLLKIIRLLFVFHSNWYHLIK